MAGLAGSPDLNCAVSRSPSSLSAIALAVYLGLRLGGGVEQSGLVGVLRPFRFASASTSAKCLLNPALPAFR